MLSRAVLFSFLLVCLSFAQLGFPNGSLPTISQPSTGTRSLLLNRNQAYYLGSIPPPASNPILWLVWNASFPNEVSGTGVLQFSQNTSDWSNLVVFQIVQGEAGGRQSIDSSWARAGQNYLRAILNQLQTPIAQLSIITNYSATVIEILSLTIGIPLVAVALFEARRKRPRTKATM